MRTLPSRLSYDYERRRTAQEIAAAAAGSDLSRMLPEDALQSRTDDKQGSSYPYLQLQEGQRTVEGRKSANSGVTASASACKPVANAYKNKEDR